MKKIIFSLFFILSAFSYVQASQLMFSSEKNLQTGQSLQMSSGQTSGSNIQKINFYISQSQCELGQTINNYDIIHITGLTLQAKPGQPLLPVKIIELNLSPNIKITGIKIINAKYIDIENTLNIAPQPQGLTYNPDKNIYTDNSCFPGKIVAFTQSTVMNNNVLYIFIYPVQYNPVTKKVILITSGEIDIYGN
ncbi:MAG: hypothetical protein M1501_03865 [Candidatus Omnitrophica bacterium]|nr:hypothetical protein [Candidatus Omnitrophota bacterium]